MNIMRKLLTGHSRGSAVSPEDCTVNKQHAALGLMHLHKVFMELMHPPQALSQEEQEHRIYNMLPLFCKVFENSPGSELTEKFSDIVPFCQMVCKLMVSEIRRRASNQSTEAASCAIAKFLEVESIEDQSNGWILLTTVNLLAAGDSSVIEVMALTSLPSTLVKCLYLFFDLPQVDDSQEVDGKSEFTPRECRILLQKVFVQILVRMFSHPVSAEELARRDDLTLLFSAITSWCPVHNTVWRKSSSEVLMTISRHGLTDTVVSYIHSKGCVAQCVENMQRVQELSPLEIVEMFVTIFCFLKDSSEVSQLLLDDFRSCQGYIFISEFLLKLERETSLEACEALRNLILLLASLTTCGFFELKPSHATSGSLFQIPGFVLPQPMGRGTSVRNIQAFQVLLTTFVKAQTPYLCHLLFDAISTIYHSDKANYFILESQHTLSQFAEKIHHKPVDVQVKFFRLLEFVVKDLKFVPCKELISLSILLKSQSSLECSITCLQTLLNILHYNNVFKDVFREVGLLEVLVTCLHRYATLLKEVCVEVDGEFQAPAVVPHEECKLGSLVMEAHIVLLKNNVNNANVFRECGGARCAHNLVPYPNCRHDALGIVQQLVLNTGGDDDMGTLLGLMHSAPIKALDLKVDILKSLLFVLGESHRTRTVFRKVGGFVYVVSVLVSMEGCLADPPRPPWNDVPQKEILILLRTVLHTLTMAMRYEPGNARFFASEICQTSLTDTVRLLGCFSSEKEVMTISSPELSGTDFFHSLFIAEDICEPVMSERAVPVSLISGCLIMRLLYHMALDTFDRPHDPLPQLWCSTPVRQISSDGSLDLSGKKKSVVAKLNFSPQTPDPLIVHPGVIIAMLHLIPSITCSTDEVMAATLQVYVAEVLRSLVRTERNQQVMCDAGFPCELLTVCKLALENESHPLHGAMQYMLERLAAQALEPRDLREFLRMGSPLCCRSFEEMGHEQERLSKNESRPANHRSGGPVPLTRVKTLVSMTTPRDCRLHGTAVTPPFVEFDMSCEGFSCLYLPSVAPQSVSGPSVVGVGMVALGAESAIIGGIGTGDRMFPPQPGLSFSTWTCVDKFGPPQPVRFLTLVLNIQGREDHLICLSILLSAQDSALLISTQEVPMPQSGCCDWEPEVKDESCISIWSPELLQEGQWHHLVIVLNRAVLKNSSMTVYLDGKHLSTQKLHYISQNPGGGAANLTIASSVYGFIGTPPQFRRPSTLQWRQGPCLLMEDVLSASTVHLLYKLGPTYIGCLQGTSQSKSDPNPPVVPEEKVMFGLNATSVSVMTLAKIRKVYSKKDSRSVAKMMGMSSHENATPIRILHNSAGHLTGPARTLGGVLFGYLGARTFVPRPVAVTIENVGGTAALLGLVAMAKDVEGVYAAVKALVCVVKSHRALEIEMDRKHRYQTLGMLLKKKYSLLNSHILHLTFSLVGTVDSGRESSVIPNISAFRDLLCDLEVWMNAPGDLHRSLFEHLYELVTESCEHRTNLGILRDVDMVSRLLYVLRCPGLTGNSSRVLYNLLAALLHNTHRKNDIRRFGQFVAATLPTMNISEEDLLPSHTGTEPKDSLAGGDLSCMVSAHGIQLRNSCLHLLHTLLLSPSRSVNLQFCEEVVMVLGFDWVQLFLQSHLHVSTVVWGLQILSALLTPPSLRSKFRDASANGGWLADTEHVLQQNMGMCVGLPVGLSSKGAGIKCEIKQEVYQIPGFQQLQWLLQEWATVPDIYLPLLTIMMGLPEQKIKMQSQLTLDTIWATLFGDQGCGKKEICLDTAVAILVLLRSLLNQIQSPSVEKLATYDYPVTLIQFLMYLYHNRQDFMYKCMTHKFLSALVSTIFPWPPEDSECLSDTASPLDEKPPIFSPDSSEHCGHEERRPTSGLLSSHPARKFVMDFIRVIVVDSLSLPVNPKQQPVVDVVLEVAPRNCSQSSLCEFQTAILSSLMDHLLAADILLGEQAALPIAVGGSYANIPSNVLHLSSCVVDKLWQGMYTREPQEVLDFILKIFIQASKQGLTIVYHSLNRAILYQLSRPMDCVTDQLAVLECLQKVTTHRSVVLSSANNDPEFIGCLCYCLLQLTTEAQVSVDCQRQTTWHVNVSTLVKESASLTSAEEGTLLIISAAQRLWQELYLSKRQVLEELFKTSLSSIHPAQDPGMPPPLHSLWDSLHEQASKLWLIFLDGERKSGYREAWQLQSQLQNRLQKVTGGLSRLASRKIKKEHSPRVATTKMSLKEAHLWTFSHISIVRDLVELHLKHRQQSQQHLQKDVFEEWLLVESELTRERGLWGPPVPSRLDKWKLDMTEGPFRMRKKMVPNEQFYANYMYRPELENGENKSLKYKLPTSFDSKEYFNRWRPQYLVEQEDTKSDLNSIASEELVIETEVAEEREVGFLGLRMAHLLPRPPANRSFSENEEEQEPVDLGPEGSAEQEETPDSQSVLRLLEEGEKISYMFRCARIQGLDTSEGLLLFGKEHFYVVDGFTLLKTREIRDIATLPANMHDPIIPSTSPHTKHQKRLCSKFAYEDIKEVHKRRYLLQPIALEVFSADGRNHLLAFPRKVRNKVYARFMTVATSITDSAQDSLAGQRRGASVESSANLLSSLIGETSVTQRWVRGEITNFQYLMHLNTLAGRSYNDLMQYPVFPWVLADYESEELDLHNSKTFRDFSKPMGAQTPDRLEQFKKRYREWDDPHGETPPYHYGTFYSSAMIVASYLLRMEPFTQHFLRLQGGHFDLADRMFHSIKDAWLSAAKHNMADVKELIPEFFYLPEFLLNSNRFDFGYKQNGVQLDDVILPPWAKGDSREFIRVHRQALESDFVSAHLHEWIDLIFGYKQQGQPAVEAVNVFHHLFYEGNVDIYSIEDPLKKNATIGFINNFGQIPKQLFKKPHPAKRLNNRTSIIDPGPIVPGLSTGQDKLFFHNLDNLRPSLHPVKELRGPVGQIVQHDKTLQAVEQNKLILPPNYTYYVAWGFADHSLRLGTYETDRATLVWEDTPFGEILCCTVPNSKVLLTSGTNTVINVWRIEKKKLVLKENLYGHTEPITCLVSSAAYNLIVSGSRDKTCIVWDLSQLVFVRQLQGHPGPVSAIAINELTGDIATCAGSFLFLWSINGQLLSSVNTATGYNDHLQQLLCVCFSQMTEWDNQNVIITGSSDGVVRMWSPDYVQVPVDPESPEISSDEGLAEASKGQEIVRRMSCITTCEDEINQYQGVLGRSFSEFSLSEDETDETLANPEDTSEPIKEKDNYSAGKNDWQNVKKLTCDTKKMKKSMLSSNSGNIQHSKSVSLLQGEQLQKTMSRSSTVTVTEGRTEQLGSLRISKSDTSLSESFVMVTEGDLIDANPSADNPIQKSEMKKQNILRQGFKWECQLVFRSKLTMHTAFDRRDNAEPAAVVALAISKDHRTIYVGDSRGRVFSWSVTDQPGRAVADHWVKDEGGENCVDCGVRFSFAERRHHCRNCGQLFCSRCSRFESQINRLRILRPVRVCQACFNILRAQQMSEALEVSS
ncbi:WD repeat and FYVE domain containing 3 bchs isoform X2 [Tachypleus tridentatus]|uniref:WD repeat and FYVE domain containing 3 bchs isoform X2 n=1 Tax=Tachypleus tridentatus TaxID=6853 RepID=UPI003FCF99CD